MSFITPTLDRAYRVSSRILDQIQFLMRLGRHLIVTWPGLVWPGVATDLNQSVSDEIITWSSTTARANLVSASFTGWSAALRKSETLKHRENIRGELNQETAGWPPVLHSVLHCELYKYILG